MIAAIASRSDRVLVVAALFFGLVAVGYLALWGDGPYMVEDSRGYLLVAQDLSDLRLGKLHFRLPGYPVLLLLTGSAESPGQFLLFVQLVLHFLASWLVLTCLWRAGVRPGACAIFGFVAALPPFVQAASTVLSENLSEFLIVGCVLCLWAWVERHSRGGLAMAALLLAVLILTKPAYQLLGFALALGLLLWRWILHRDGPHMKAAALMAATSLVTVSSIILFNWLSFGFPGVSLTGVHLSMKTGNYLEAVPEEFEKVRDVLIKHRDRHLLTSRHHRSEGYIHRALPELQEVLGLDEAELSRLMTQVNLEIIKREPRNFFQEVLRSHGSFWMPYSTNAPGLRSASLQAIWFALHFMIGLSFFVWGGTLVGNALHERPEYQGKGPRWWPHSSAGFLSWLCFVTVVYTAALSSVLGDGAPRYRSPVELLVLAVAIAGWSAAAGQQSPATNNLVARVVKEG